MLNTKKTVLAAAVALTMGAGIAEAAPVVNFNFAGSFTMYQPDGIVFGQYNDVTGTMSMDFGTGAGTAAISSPTPFSGYNWVAHDITMQATGPSTAVATMLFDWGADDATTCGKVNCDIVVTVDFSMTPIGSNAYGPILQIATLDGPGGDGIPGNPMAGGPFPGWNATFGGVATAVPVPAAVWLLGSGLLGLVGVSRRKKAA